MQKPIDLTTCETESIHIPNKIQAFGFLLVIDINNLLILQVSSNIISYIGKDARTLLQTSLENYLSEESVKLLKKIIASQDYAMYSPFSLFFVGNLQFTCVAHAIGAYLVIEFEQADIHSLSYNNFYYHINSIAQELQNSKTIEDLATVAVKKVKYLTMYDRVMLYRFDENWNGEVIAEIKESWLTSYEGLHFPASDIPPQARELYLKNWVRIIPDVGYTYAEIIPALHPITQQYLDMSYVALRSISPMHIEYLQNMGVKATLTISIIFEGKLWGLIACHHYDTKYISYGMRKAVEFFGKLFSYHLGLQQENIYQNFIHQAEHTKYEILKQLSGKDNFFYTISKILPEILSLTHASGLAICYEEAILTQGNTPKQEDILIILKWLDKIQKKDIYFTNKLSEVLPQAKNYVAIASGILAIRISPNSSNFVIWFAPEVLQEVKWGGNPEEKLVVNTTDGSQRLSPRKSFEIWKQTIKNQSMPWTSAEINIVTELRTNIIELLAIKAEKFREQLGKMRILVKNRTKQVQDAYTNLQTAHEQLANYSNTLQEAYKQILQQNDQLSEVAQMQSHELRKPLANIMGLIDILDYENPTDNFNREILAKIVEQANELDLIVRKITQTSNKHTNINFDHDDKFIIK
jgi:light-regulated signal transduction histidine kinase (bacteriophytochrome)